MLPRRIDETSFNADVVHDLDNLIANIRIRLALIRKSSDTIADHLAVIEQQTERLHALTQDLLLVAYLDQPGSEMRFSSITMNHIVQSMLDIYTPLAEGKCLEIVFDAAPDLPFVKADPVQIERLLANLIVNALNYTPRGGAIRLSTQYDAEWMLFVIADTGIGILPEALPHIFERFYRADNARQTTRGTGLGLAIVKEIVDHHQGRIEVESFLGQGTRFCVYLPLVDRFNRKDIL